MNIKQVLDIAIGTVGFAVLLVVVLLWFNYISEGRKDRELLRSDVRYWENMVKDAYKKN